MPVTDDAHQEMAEKRLETIKSLLGTAWRSDPAEVQALIDRLTANAGLTFQIEE